jgi:hypothetical protein
VSTRQLCVHCNRGVTVADVGLRRTLGFNAFELKNKIATELHEAGVFVGGFTLVEAAPPTKA